MDREEAIIRLSAWDDQELFYKDYLDVQNGILPGSCLHDRWGTRGEDYLSAISSLDNTVLLESHYLEASYDIAISKSPRYTLPFWHAHEFFELVYVLSGNCCIYINNECIPLSQGDFFMIAPQVSHQISTKSPDTIALNILIRSSTLLNIFLNSLRDRTLISVFFLSHTCHGGSYHNDYLIFHTGKDEIIRNYILDIYLESLEHDACSNRILVSLANILFAQLIRRHAEHVEMPVSAERNSELITDIIGYIIDHFTDCTLSSLAEHLHFSMTYCSRIIKETTGCTFSQLLAEVRISKAASLLTTTPMKIEEISTYLGYKNPETLIRVFKKLTGSTPSAYRKKQSV
ncbi:MAG: AraC family transcriptional regulator [Lachnospiraceae bacterium]|nr:AraC family transcriptional regulator [Lachnospiraceae bacterium]